MFLYIRVHFEGVKSFKIEIQFAFISIFNTKDSRCVHIKKKKKKNKIRRKLVHRTKAINYQSTRERYFLLDFQIKYKIISI